MTYPPKNSERYKTQRATEVLRDMLEHDPSLQDLISAGMLQRREGDLVLAPKVLKALWRMNRWSRPVQAIDQTEWMPS